MQSLNALRQGIRVLEVVAVVAGVAVASVDAIATGVAIEAAFPDKRSGVGLCGGCVGPGAGAPEIRC